MAKAYLCLQSWTDSYRAFHLSRVPLGAARLQAGVSGAPNITAAHCYNESSGSLSATQAMPLLFLPCVAFRQRQAAARGNKMPCRTAQTISRKIRRENSSACDNA